MRLARRSRFLASAAILALFLAACGGDGPRDGADAALAVDAVDTAGELSEPSDARIDGPADTPTAPDLGGSDVATPDVAAADLGVDAGPPCTEDVQCDDANACTDDVCQGAFGCVHIPRACDDGNRCTDDSCDPDTGLCGHRSARCDDGNPCTDETCVPTTGCVYTLSACDDGDACTDDGCSPASGCIHARRLCDDGDACTNDACQPATGACVNAAVPGCCRNAADCFDDDACTQDVCSAGRCSHPSVTDPACCNAAADCDDGNPCSEDLCGNHVCVHMGGAAEGCCELAADCAAGPCEEALCEDFRCVARPVAGCCVPTVDACDDADPCTEDRCDPASRDGVCVHAVLPGCCRDAADCDDGDPCTADVCSGAGGVCTRTALPGCCHVAAECDDGDPCTDDWCLGGRCTSDGACCTLADECVVDGECRAPRCDDGRCRFAPAPEGCCRPILVADRLDGTTTDLVLASSVPPIGWFLEGDGPTFSPPGALRFGLAGTEGYAAPVAASGTATLGPFLVPADTVVTLRFAVRMDVEPDLDVDRLDVRATGVFGEVRLWSKRGLVRMEEWQEVAVALPEALGAPFSIVFAFDAVDVIGNDTGGAWLDDVRLEAACPAVGP